MMEKEKVLIPLYDKEVAPRFDLTAEAVIIAIDQSRTGWTEKFVVLPEMSAEKLCHLLLTEGAGTLICGGIDDEYYQYLTWKRVQIFDSVIGPWQAVLGRFLRNELVAGDIVTED